MNQPDAKIHHGLVDGDLELAGQIKVLGLTQLEGDYIQSGNIALSKFQREPSGDIPALEVVVERSGSGHHVIVNTLPYDERYHRSTNSYIQREEVVDQIAQYLTEIESPKD